MKGGADMEGFDNLKFYINGTRIMLWHEKTLFEMRKNLQDLRRKIHG